MKREIINGTLNATSDAIPTFVNKKTPPASRTPTPPIDGIEEMIAIIGTNIKKYTSARSACKALAIKKNEIAKMHCETHDKPNA